MSLKNAAVQAAGHRRAETTTSDIAQAGREFQLIKQVAELVLIAVAVQLLLPRS
jgi:hypothetical protein